MRAARLREQVATTRTLSSIEPSLDAINRLPAFALAAVLAQLDERAIRLVASVCTHWHAVSHSDVLWRALSLRRFSAEVRFELDEVAEEFLEEYGWRRLHRELCELKQLKLRLVEQRATVSAVVGGARRTRELKLHRVAEARAALAALSAADVGEVTRLQRTDGAEAVLCAVMVLIRAESVWDEALRRAGALGFCAKLVAADHSSCNPGVVHRAARFTERPEFSKAMAQSGRCPALRALGNWALASLDYGRTTHELEPEMRSISSIDEALPAATKEYEARKSEIEEVIGEGCFLEAPAAGEDAKEERAAAPAAREVEI